MKNACLVLIALLFASLCPGNLFATGGGGVYSGSFTFNQVASAQAVQDWINFRSSLTPSAYDTVTISGTFDPVGRTLTDAMIVPQIAAALKNGTAGSWTAGGFTWNVGLGCGGFGNVELNANQSGDGSTCICLGATSYVVRPQIGNENWGGVNTTTCNAPDQTLNVVFSCPGNYNVTTTTGVAIVPGTNDIGNHCDDCTTPIMLPFPVMFYNQVFSGVNVSSNGNLQFTSNTNQTSSCLPTSNANNLIAPGWTDLYTFDSGSGEGIFTSISGVAPNRIFNIEWRTQYCCSSGPPVVNFEVRLYEGLRRIDFIYGAIASGLGGIGIQRDTGSQSTIISCNVTPAPGTQYTFDTCAGTTISTVASAPAANLGESISDTATVIGPVIPTGTVTFQIFGPNDSNCSGAPIFTSTVALDGNGQATSAPFRPTLPGSYNFVATYNGDANNSVIATNCGDPNEFVVVSGNEVDGRGTIGVSGGQASFDLTVQNLKKGHHSFMYSDPANHLSFSSNKLSPLTIDGNHASFSGMAKMGKTRFNFTVDAYDNGLWGDQLFISTTTGYMAGGTITSGDVEIHYDMPRR